MFIENDLHLRFMRAAFQQALQAFEQDEVPVGAVITHRHKVIGAAHNQMRTLRDPTAHAEMLAITQAAEAMGDWRLEETVLYVTLEPCIMCAGAILNARIPQLIYGASEPKGGGVESMYCLLQDSRLNHRTEVIKGVMESECGELMTTFFRQQRELGKK